MIKGQDVFVDTRELLLFHVAGNGTLMGRLLVIPIQRSVVLGIVVYNTTVRAVIVASVSSPEQPWIYGLNRGTGTFQRNLNRSCSGLPLADG